MRAWLTIIMADTSTGFSIFVGDFYICIRRRLVSHDGFVGRYGTLLTCELLFSLRFKAYVFTYVLEYVCLHIYIYSQ